MTQEFKISVTPVGQNDYYLVRIEPGFAPGVLPAEELLNLPVADWLTQARYLMEDPLQSLWQGNAITKTAVNLAGLGQQLYNALFQGTLRDSWITAQGIAQNQQQVLRLRLGLKDPKLARLPWEVMHAGDRPLATGPYVAFSRYQAGTLAMETPSSANKLRLPQEGVRVLMVISSPRDLAGLELLKQESIKLKAELHHRFQQSVHTGDHLPQIQLTLLEQPGREELTTALEQGRYDVLHYAGHSNLGPGGGEIYLVNNKNGLTEALRGDDLAGLLVNNGVQMAVFNSCLGALPARFNPSTDTGERSLTESLVKRGISGVVAMTERIPDEVALTFTQLFYRNLSYGHPLDVCLSRVRQGLISAYGSQQIYWALPILYLHEKFDGYLSPDMRLYPHDELLPIDDEQLMPLSVVGLGNTANTDAPRIDRHAIAFPLEDMEDPDSLGELDLLNDEPWVDDIEYDDPSYGADKEAVLDIFKNLNNQSVGTESQTLGKTGIASAVTQSATQPASPQSVVTPQENPFKRNLWAILGAVSISVMTLVGTSWWWLQQRNNTSIPEFPPIPGATTGVLPTSGDPSVDLSKVDVNRADIKTVTASAIASFNKGDLQAGLKAVEVLLNNNNLPQAKDALASVGKNQIDDPAVSFLRGRLAWQFVHNNKQNSKKDFSIDDARRGWEIAVKGNPKSARYYNALGFAHYAEGNLNRANDAWFKALYIAQEQQERENTLNSSASPSPKSRSLNQDALTAYAGLALAMKKSAYTTQSPDTKTRLITEAIKLRQIVQQNDPSNFQPNNLAKNWLWTEQTIKDWQALLQEKG